MSLKNNIWVEKYRPKTLDDLIIPENVYNKFKNGINNHALLYGSPGLGKTSLARIVAGSNPTLEINCSLETGVDVVRDRVVDFCSNLTIFGGEKKQKIVILDEFDGASTQMKKSLRGVIEQFANTSRFIATCNYIQEIPDNIQSRFDCINFDFPKDQEKILIKKYVNKINYICSKEKLLLELGSEAKILVAITKKHFPDLRSTISMLQSLKEEGVNIITETEINKFRSEFIDFFDNLFKKVDFIELYKYAYKNFLNNEDLFFSIMSNQFISYCIEKEIDSSKIGLILETIVDYNYKSKFIVDRFSSVAACIKKITSI